MCTRQAVIHPIRSAATGSSTIGWSSSVMIHHVAPDAGAPVALPGAPPCHPGPPAARSSHHPHPKVSAQTASRALRTIDTVSSLTPPDSIGVVCSSCTPPHPPHACSLLLNSPLHSAPLLSSSLYYRGGCVSHRSQHPRPRSLPRRPRRPSPTLRTSASAPPPPPALPSPCGLR